MKNKSLFIIVVFMLISLSIIAQQKGTFTDPRDGKIYKTVKIGSQTWMAENLKAKKYRDGAVIPNVSNGSNWSEFTTGAYCSYANDISSANSFGFLYNWYAVHSGKLCPTGWHIPTDAEWTTLINYLGGDSVAGVKLRESGTNHWSEENIGTNSSGFSALPTGLRYGKYKSNSGNFYGNRFSCYWWSSSDTTENKAWFQSMTDNDKDISRSMQEKSFGFAVRCVKD